MLDKTLKEFSEALFSKDPTPGGGGASALAGALAASLGGMVTNLTVGKKTYAQYEEENQKIMRQADDLRLALLEAIDQDAQAFAPLAEAYKLDKNTPHYEEIMEKALLEAAFIPCKILKLCTEVMDLDAHLAETGSKLAISDAATSVMLAYGAMYGALINIRVNTRLMKKREEAEKIDKEALELVNVYGSKAKEIYEKVEERLGL